MDKLYKFFFEKFAAYAMAVVLTIQHPYYALLCLYFIVGLYCWSVVKRSPESDKPDYVPDAFDFLFCFFLPWFAGCIIMGVKEGRATILRDIKPIYSNKRYYLRSPIVFLTMKNENPKSNIKEPNKGKARFTADECPCGEIFLPEPSFPKNQTARG